MRGTLMLRSAFAYSTPKLAPLWHVGGGGAFVRNCPDDVEHPAAEVASCFSISHAEGGQGNPFSDARSVRLVVQQAGELHVGKRFIKVREQGGFLYAFSPPAEDQGWRSGLRCHRTQASQAVFRGPRRRS